MDFVFTAEDINTMWWAVDSECMSDDMKTLAFILAEIYDQMKNHNINSVSIHLEV